MTKRKTTVTDKGQQTKPVRTRSKAKTTTGESSLPTESKNDLHPEVKALTLDEVMAVIENVLIGPDTQEETEQIITEESVEASMARWLELDDPIRQQVRIIIYHALKNLSQVRNLQPITDIPTQMHIWTSVVKDGGVDWFVTELGPFMDGTQDGTLTRAINQNMSAVFIRTHPEFGVDRRVMVSKVIISPKAGNKITISVKWRLVDNNDLLFRQSTQGRVDLNTYWIAPENFPEARYVLFKDEIDKDDIAAITAKQDEVVQTVGTSAAADSSTTDDGEDDEPRPDGTFHLLNDVGLHKDTVKARFERGWNVTDPDNRAMQELLAARSQYYTLEQLDMISAYTLSDAVLNVLDSYYAAEGKSVPGVSNIDITNAMKAQGDFDKLRDFIESRMSALPTPTMLSQ